MAEAPVWAEILEKIYRENIVWSPDDDFDDEHPVISEVEFEAETVQENLAMLSQSGLVGRVHVGIPADITRPGKEGIVGMSDRAKREGSHIGLTPRGFHVAHEREVMDQEKDEQDRRIQSQNEINSALGFLTLGLLFVNFSDTWILATLDTPVASWPESILLWFVADVVIVGVLAVMLYRTELLDPQSHIENTN